MLIIKGARGVSRDLLEMVSVKEVEMYHVLLMICEKVLKDVRARFHHRGLDILWKL